MLKHRLYVIGDVHGCLSALKDLLDQIDRDAYNPENATIVFLGDYIDRGPSSKQVINLLINRKETHAIKHVFLRGNHEDFIVGELSTGSPDLWIMNGGRETLKSYNYDPMKHEYIFNCIPAKHWDFYRKTLTYYTHGRIVCVHAGIDPTLPLDLQTEDTMLWAREFVNYDGEYHDNKFVVFGHTPVQYVKENKNSLGIDTGCVFGGNLTCAVIEPETATIVKFLRSKQS